MRAVHAIAEEKRFVRFRLIQPLTDMIGIDGVPQMQVFLFIRICGSGQHLVVAQLAGCVGVQIPAGFMLDAAQDSMIAMTPQKLRQMAAVVGQSKPPLSQTKHPVLMRIGPCQQRRAAGRTGRPRAVCLGEYGGIPGKRQQIVRRCVHAVGAYHPPAVMGVNIQNIHDYSPFFSTKTGLVQAHPPFLSQIRKRRCLTSLRSSVLSSWT